MSDSVTVPLHVEFNRPFIDLEFLRLDGTKRRACTWVDTGGTAFVLTERLARELELELGDVEQGVAPTLREPDVYLGEMRLEVSGAYPCVQPNSTLIQVGFSAEAFMPSRVLKNHHVIFDYPGKTFTLATPNSLESRGMKLATPVSREIAFPRIELEIQGERYGFLLDTGAPYTMLSRAVMEKLNLQQAVGAVGAANMGAGARGEENLTLARINAKLGDVDLENIGVVARPEGTFENYMSEMMTAPIVGALAGNVLKAFRLEIDYANGYTYWEQTGTLEPNDLDLVGLVLRPENDGSYTIVGLSEQSHPLTLESVKPNDVLKAVNGQNVEGQMMAFVVDLLRGEPGETKLLMLERDGQRLELEVPVSRIL
jgi:predicted aspartyl protease